MVSTSLQSLTLLCDVRKTPSFQVWIFIDHLTLIILIFTANGNYCQWKKALDYFLSPPFVCCDFPIFLVGQWTQLWLKSLFIYNFRKTFIEYPPPSVYQSLSLIAQSGPSLEEFTCFSSGTWTAEARRQGWATEEIPIKENK